MLIHQMLETSAGLFPDRPAVWNRGAWTTYAETNALADKMAAALSSRGIGPGDRVAILYENSLDFVIAYYGTLKAGAITVALNTETTASALSSLLGHSGARALITQRRFERVIGPALGEAPNVDLVILDRDLPRAAETQGLPPRLTLESVYHGQEAGLHVISREPGDAASIVYTSGSTGRPKGVTLSHHNIVSNTRAVAGYLGLTPADRIMVVLPFPYIYGLSLLNTHVFSGGSVVIDNRFSFPQAILETMRDTGVTGFAGVPSTFLILLHRSAVRKFRFPSLRYVTQAGGGMAPAVQKEVARVFDPARLYVMYGATEAAARLSYLNPEALSRKWGSIGKPVPGVDLFVVGPDDRELAAGEVGEIVARGPNIMIGYWRDPEATALALRNGLYHTGDLGYEDDEGFLFLTGRASDIIKPGGLRVSAREIEDSLYELEGVHEAAVVGVPDSILGEAVKAFIVPRDPGGLDPDEIRKELAKRLPPYKIPKVIELAATLPRNESGKILKDRLRGG